MTFAPGDRIGLYEILSAVGAGGMGEVYRAKDIKLNRDVALKILPETFELDPDRLARFKREAQVLAALNHPHIAHIHGLDEIDGCHFLVMELVDGESLDKRIARGTIPLDDALPIARQIADALEAAHEKGIIHRDLKPANVALTSNGAVKVLDFGLAKTMEPTSPSSFDPTNSPTITSPAMMTGVGTILGTAAYMSPEQAKGRPADKRSDIWAFGCVLYELLTGTRAFGGEDVGDTLASILMKTPDWAALPAQTAAPIRLLLRRCLQKDPTQRLDSAVAARLEIADVVAAPSAGFGDSRLMVRQTSWTPRVLGVLGGLFLVALGAAWLQWPSGSRTLGPTIRLDLNLPEGVEWFRSSGPGIALSSDGTRIAFVGTSLRTGERQLYVRRVDDTQPVVVRGPLPNSSACFFSPNGDAVGFIEPNGTVLKVTLADAVVVPLAHDADWTTGATWSADGRIIFIRQHALWQVSAEGGAATPLLALDRESGEVAHAWPRVVSASPAIVFASVKEGRRDAQIEALSFTSGKRQVLVAGDAPLAASGGRLVFVRGGDLFAVPFDGDRLTVRGTPVRVIDDVAVATQGGPLAAVSDTGSLVYASSATVKSRLVWVTRDGLEQPVTDVERDYATPRLAPDGRKIAVAAGEHLWIYDMLRATFTRITADDTTGAVLFPTWTPDGTRLVFTSPTKGLQWVDADGTGRTRAIPDTAGSDFPTSTSPDGETVAFVRISADTSGDIYTVSLHGASKPRAVVKTPAYDGGPEFSPDGRWLAYTSDDSGQPQVYLRPVAGPDRRWPVSTQIGRAPKWSRSGRELFYIEGSKMMVVSVTSTAADFRLSPPAVLFERAYAFGPTLSIANYDVSPDGQRFLMVKSHAGSEHLHVVLNWQEELKRLVPTK